MKKLDVIIPVYKGFDETRECIESITPTLPEWAELIIINDCSPEAELADWLREQANKGLFTLLENDENLGFVGTVNRGMMYNADRDVILVNSDVEVPNSDWLTRIRDAAYSKKRVASVTPFSNNATICSFPNFCQDNELFAGLSVSQLDAVFSTLSLEEKIVKVPTGVGFCMYIRRDCLNEVGLFDQETFGKGYGEENDWCQRAEKKGWNNYHQLNVFIYHKGGVSFQAEGDPRKEKALELLTNLHPDYLADVHKFIIHDPARKARLQAKIAILASIDTPKIVLVSHKLGGGVSQHLDELCHFYHRKAWFIKLEPFHDGESVAITLDILGRSETEKLIFDVVSQSEDLIKFLSAIGISHFHFHHTMGIHPLIWFLPEKLGIKYDITIHDYYMVNGNPTLTDMNGVFAGDNISLRDNLCAEHYPIPTTPDEWRKGVYPLLSNAERVIFPSADCANRFIASFSYIKAKSIVSHHPDSINLREVTSENAVNLHIPDNRSLRILILGALSREKGANLLEDVAKKCPEIEFHLLGYAYRPLDAVITHGAYNQDNLDRLIAEINPDVVWFPALWPETYSYTLSVALKHNLPVVCPNIGAFPERIICRESSYLVPWDYTSDDFTAYWRTLSSKNVDSISQLSKSLQIAHKLDIEISNNSKFYESEYLQSISKNIPQSLDPIAMAELLNTIYRHQHSPEKSTKEQALIIIWKIRNSWAGRRLAKLIPFHIQRKVKRWFSQKPLHNIL